MFDNLDLNTICILRNAIEASFSNYTKEYPLKELKEEVNIYNMLTDKYNSLQNLQGINKNGYLIAENLIKLFE